MEETQTGHWRWLATALCQGQPARSWQAHRGIQTVSPDPQQMYRQGP